VFASSKLFAVAASYLSACASLYGCEQSIAVQMLQQEEEGGTCWQWQHVALLQVLPLHEWNWAGEMARSNNSEHGKNAILRP